MCASEHAWWSDDHHRRPDQEDEWARGDAWRAVVVALVRLVRTCSSGILYADVPFFPCRGGRRKGDFQILQGGGMSDCCACNVGVYAGGDMRPERKVRVALCGFGNAF